jgi:hypothetical protein
MRLIWLSACSVLMPAALNPAIALLLHCCHGSPFRQCVQNLIDREPKEFSPAQCPQGNTLDDGGPHHCVKVDLGVEVRAHEQHI